MVFADFQDSSCEEAPQPMELEKHFDWEVVAKTEEGLNVTAPTPSKQQPPVNRRNDGNIYGILMT